MAFEYRIALDYVFGTLQTPAAVSDTELSSTAFSRLADDSIVNTSIYIPLSLHDPATGLREMVWVTGHATGSHTVTVVRGREGTTAQAWPAGTQVVCAPTAARDGLVALSTPDLPPDPHVGMRVVLGDTGRVAEWTRTAGWQAAVGAALGDEVGRHRDGRIPPPQATLVVRGGHHTGGTDGGGRLVVPFLTPFPTGCLTGVVLSNNGAAFHGLYTMEGEDASGLTVTAWNVLGNVPHAFAQVSVAYLALGY